MIVNNLITYCFDQQMMQRFQAAKTKKTAQRALLLNIPIVFVLVTLCCSVGLIVYANFYNCDPLTKPDNRIKNPNQLVPYFVINNLYMIPGVAGLFLGALFCASLSSVSSSLNSQSSIIWTDFLCIFAYFKQFDDTQSLRTNKLIVLICGLVSTALSFAVSVIGGNLIQISSILNGAFVAPLTGLFVLGLFFSISNSVGAIAGTVCGFIASCWISFGVFIVKPTFPKLSTSIEGCSGYETTMNMTTLTSFQYYSSTKTPELDLGFNKFYYLSYMWYTTFGTLVTVFFGLLFSLVTKKWDKHNNQAFVLLDFFGFIKIFKSFSKKLSNK
jgi:sodium-coupled monocarboxylate transporter 8/12